MSGERWVPATAMRRVGAVSAALSLAAGVGTVILAHGPAHAITDAGRSVAAGVLTLGAGAALGLAGGVLLVERRANRGAILLLLASITWYAPVWVGWTDGPPTVRSLAALLPGFTLPFLLHATLSHRVGRVGSRWVGTLIGLAYLEAFLATGALALFRDPYFDSSCWANCSVNTFLLTSQPRLVDDVELIDRWTVVAVAVAFAATCTMQLVAASSAARIRLVPTRLPALVFAALAVAHAVAQQRTTFEDPFDAALAVIYQLTCWTLIAVGAGFVWSSVRAAAERRAVSRIAMELDEAPAPGTLRAALVAALRDPLLRVAYWLPSEHRFVDADGAPVTAPAAAAGRTLTSLTREGQTVAVIDHVAAVADHLEDQFGPSLRLGLENERLQAEVLAELETLRASRTRIVSTGDAERRTLERNLHDGAQQQLLALSYDLRLARSAAETDGDSATAELLDVAVGEAQGAIDDLRELAQGIYPAVLAEAGLAPALELLALVASLPVEFGAIEHERYPAGVETAAYLAVSEAVDSAARGGAKHALVSVVRADSALVVSVRSDRLAEGQHLVSIADRVGALGGTVVVADGECRAVIPCV